jgi:integrase
MALLIACKSGDYRSLDATAREACIRLFQNQGLEPPSDLGGNEPAKELTLWEAVQIFLRYPTVKNSPTKERYGYCLSNLVEKLGTNRPIKGLWVPDLRLYQSDRLTDGAAPGTVNREMSTLSKLFTILIELQYLDANPVRLVKRLQPDHREVYISAQDFHRINDVCPPWYQPIVQTAFYSGMRRGEIMGLSRRQVNLGTRIIRLGARDTKERRVKRVPVHKDLVPVLEQCMKVTSLESDRVFLIQDQTGIRPPSIESTKNPWRRHVPKLGLDPAPRFHDLRHTWKTNARRSGMDPEIREAILGHWMKEKSVTERYGRISDQELLKAIDDMTFDHGQTEIWASR